MIKYWQSMQDYEYFLAESRVRFDSSERNRLYKELWKPWQKLRLFDTDKAMEFLLPFYSAMDNYPTYRFLKNRGIRAFIDLNSKCGHPKTIPDTITIDKDGTPLCREKLRMKPNGYDKASGYLMWRCPYGKEHCSKCKNSCTSSRYGRVVKTRPE